MYRNCLYSKHEIIFLELDLLSNSLQLIAWIIRIFARHSLMLNTCSKEYRSGFNALRKPNSVINPNSALIRLRSHFVLLFFFGIQKLFLNQNTNPNQNPNPKYVYVYTAEILPKYNRTRVRCGNSTNF